MKNHKIARMVLDGKMALAGKTKKPVNVSFDIVLQRAVFDKIIAEEAGNRHFEFLITPAGFLRFPFPKELQNQKRKELQAPQFIEQFQKAAEELLIEFIGNNAKALAKLTDYFIVGIDGRNPKNNQTIELIAVYDTAQKAVIHWSGKSYPVASQRSTLVRITDIDSHRITLNGQNVLLLDCNDLNAFSPRIRSNMNDDSPVGKIIHAFQRVSKKCKPEVVLHLPHSVDTSKTWRSKWNLLLTELKSVKHYASSVNYSSGNNVLREDLETVMQKTCGGDVADLIYVGK